MPVMTGNDGRTDEEEKQLVAIRTRRGRADFRNRLHCAYGATCAISGSTVEPLLEAASATEKSSRQLSALDRIPQSIQSALSFSHREHPTSVWDLCGDTVIDAVSQIPTRSPQSLKKPHCSRAFAQKGYNARPKSW